MGLCENKENGLGLWLEGRRMGPSRDGYWEIEVQEEPATLKSEGVCGRHKEEAREWTERWR